MATKPVTSFTFATDANFAAGPAAGFPVTIIPPAPAQGHVPGDGVVAEYVNYHTNILGEWTGWLLAGSSLASLDAHLVETDSLGSTNLAQLDIGGTASGTVALRVSQNTGAESAAAMIDNTGAGFGVLASSSDTLAAVRGVASGTGPGVEGIALGTNNIGVRGTGQGTGSGASFTGGATGSGVIATGGATSGYGALCTGMDGFAGVSGIGGATATEAVLGTASWNEQMGVRGVAHASGLTTGGGVIGVGQGDAPGVRSTATSGYGVILESDATSPTRSAGRLVPQNADPTTPQMGDFMHRSDIDIGRVYTDSIWQSPWTTARGHAHGIASPRTTNATNASDVNYVTLVTCTLAGPYEPRFAGGTLILFASARFGDANSANHHYFIDVQILDTTSAAVVFAKTIATGAANADPTIDGFAISGWSLTVPYTVPAAGSRSFDLRFKVSASNGVDAVANDCSLFAVGVFG